MPINILKPRVRLFQALQYNGDNIDEVREFVGKDNIELCSNFEGRFLINDSVSDRDGGNIISKGDYIIKNYPDLTSYDGKDHFGTYTEYFVKHNLELVE